MSNGQPVRQAQATACTKHLGSGEVRLVSVSTSVSLFRSFITYAFKAERLSHTQAPLQMRGKQPDFAALVLWLKHWMETEKAAGDLDSIASFATDTLCAVGQVL